MPFEPGRILLAQFPFTDRTAGKLRPVLVISGLDFNQGEDFVVVPVSSRLTPDDPYVYPLLDTEPYFAATQLRESSAVKWTKPVTISAMVVQRRLGVVPPAVLSQIQSLVRSVIS